MKKYFIALLIFGISNTGFSQDTVKAEIDTANTGEIIEPVIKTDAPEIQNTEKETISPEVENIVEPPKIIEEQVLQDTGKVIIVSDKVGEEIDAKEKKQYNLFSNYSKKEFKSAQFFEKADGSIFLRVLKKNGESEYKSFTKEEFLSVKNELDKEESKEETTAKTAETEKKEETPVETEQKKEPKEKEKKSIADLIVNALGAVLVIVAIIIFPF